MLKKIQQVLLPKRDRAIEAKGLLALKERAERMGNSELYDWTVKGLEQGVVFVPSDQLKELTYGHKPGPKNEE